MPGIIGNSKMREGPIGVLWLPPEAQIYRGPQDAANRGIRAAHTLAQPELKRLEEFGGDADGDPFGGFRDRIARKVCIARGGFDPAVPEEPADDRQALAERERPRGEGMA